MKIILKSSKASKGFTRNASLIITKLSKTQQSCPLGVSGSDNQREPQIPLDYDPLLLNTLPVSDGFHHSV